MMRKPVPGLFVVGTDTGVGKTYVAAMIARALRASGRRVGVYKPAASGCRRVSGELISDDALALWEAAARPGDLTRVCPQKFEAPLAPHLAAHAGGTRVDSELLRSGLDFWIGRSDIVVVEGVGGLMSPVTNDEYVADLAQDFNLPLVVVAANRLGAINQTLQTLIVAETFRGGLSIAGVVLNQVDERVNDKSLTSNRRELAARAMAPILADVAWGADRFDPPVDWFELAAGDQRGAGESYLTT